MSGWHEINIERKPTFIDHLIDYVVGLGAVSTVMCCLLAVAAQAVAHQEVIESLMHAK